MQSVPGVCTRATTLHQEKHNLLYWLVSNAIVIPSAQVVHVSMYRNIGVCLHDELNVLRATS